MAIDVTTFAADLPAGTYTAGDTVELVCTSGPKVVRSGRGAALLKRISSFFMGPTTGSTHWRIDVQNSDWVDKTSSFAVLMTNPTAMDVRTGAIQAGHDCPLTPNSEWKVTATCIIGNTTTVAASLTAEIEIDYPSVSAITDPTKLAGIPASINVSNAVTINATGSATTANWEIINVDFFKAGFEYALEKVELSVPAANVMGYISLSNAAGMGGLTRIIPITADRDNIRPLIEYASKLVKGPLDIGFKLFATTASTSTANVTFDFVKRRI